MSAERSLPEHPDGMAVPDCLFCRIVAGEVPATVVHETPTTLAFRDINPQAATHVLVVPREHHEDALSLATEAPDLLAEVLRAAGEVAGKEGVTDSGYRLVFNTGKHAGRIVFHVHLHLLGGEPLGQFGTRRPG
jgi:histidine triad (HIT) family protein